MEHPFEGGYYLVTKKGYLTTNNSDGGYFPVDEDTLFYSVPFTREEEWTYKFTSHSTETSIAKDRHYQDLGINSGHSNLMTPAVLGFTYDDLDTLNSRTGTIVPIMQNDGFLLEVANSPLEVQTDTYLDKDFLVIRQKDGKQEIVLTDSDILCWEDI